MENLKFRSGAYTIQTFFSAFSKETVNAIIDVKFYIWKLLHKLCVKSLKARDNFQDNKIFDLKKFRLCSIKKVYDSLHGISRDYVELSEIVEIMAYCLIDGKIEQKSVFETRLYDDLLEQLRNDKEWFCRLAFFSR